MDEQTRKNVSNNLKRLRSYYWLTQKVVAKQIGVAESTMSSYENTGFVPESKLEVLAYYYEVTPESLLGPWPEVEKQLTPP